MSSPTAHLLDELALYGYRPGQDEPDPRPLPENETVRAELGAIVDGFASMFTDTRQRFVRWFLAGRLRIGRKSFRQHYHGLRERLPIHAFARAGRRGTFSPASAAATVSSFSSWGRDVNQPCAPSGPLPKHRRVEKKALFPADFRRMADAASRSLWS
jgi:hypothetical protein